MAAFTSIKGSPVAALKHDLRERENYQNPDIDQERSHLNCTLSPYGDTVKECMDRYEKLTEHAYHRGKGTITTAEWVVTAPADLPQEKEKEFFERAYEFLNKFFYAGDDSRCLLAQVHYIYNWDQQHYVYIFMAMALNMMKMVVIGVRLAWN